MVAFRMGERPGRRISALLGVLLYLGLVQVAPGAAYGESAASTSAVSDANFHQLVIVL